MPVTDLTFWLGLALAGYVMLTPARQRWMGVLGGLLLVSPGLRWLTTVFGFSIRLQLSGWAASLLRQVGADATAHGNLIQVNGRAFAVDPACVGLQMMGLSVLASLFLIIHLENRTRKRLSFGWLAVVAAGTGAVVLLTNLVRILTLVLFQIDPDDPVHDVVGLACLAFYLLLPLNLSLPWLYERFGKPVPTGSRLAWKRLGLLYGFAGLAGFGLVQRSQPKAPVRVTVPAGYVGKPVEYGFCQYSKSGVLVYLKPLRTAYSAEHSPTVCWRGSGYTFGPVVEKRLNGHWVYVGSLQRGRERLYTAWWFTNGSCRTTSQTDFRWRMLRGEPGFALLNVTVDRSDALEEAVKVWY